MPTQAVLLGSLTIPGQPICLREARDFVERTLHGLSCSDTAVLLTSELVTNSVQHSSSGGPDGTVTITLVSMAAGIRVEVVDDGGENAPEVTTQPDHAELAEDGRGLQLVEVLSAKWGHYRDSAGTVTWFELTGPSP